METRNKEGTTNSQHEISVSSPNVCVGMGIEPATLADATGAQTTAIKGSPNLTEDANLSYTILVAIFYRQDEMRDIMQRYGYPKNKCGISLKYIKNK